MAGVCSLVNDILTLLMRSNRRLSDRPSLIHRLFFLFLCFSFFFLFGPFPRLRELGLYSRCPLTILAFSLSMYHIPCSISSFYAVVPQVPRFLFLLTSLPFLALFLSILLFCSLSSSLYSLQANRPTNPHSPPIPHMCLPFMALPSPSNFFQIYINQCNTNLNALGGMFFLFYKTTNKFHSMYIHS